MACTMGSAKTVLLGCIPRVNPGHGTKQCVANTHGAGKRVKQTGRVDEEKERQRFKNRCMLPILLPGGKGLLREAGKE